MVIQAARYRRCAVASLGGIPGNFARGWARPRAINLVLSGSDNGDDEKRRKFWTRKRK